MPGGVYNVFQAVQFTPQALDVPEELAGTKVKLKPMDGDAVEVEAEAICLSDKLKKLASENGPGTELNCPVKKATLGKVIEYLTYHKDTPPAEVQTPLVGETIAECGVSKWDVNFIKGDKDMLFELMYAGGVLDIQSLTFLCCVQVSLMMKGKAGDKLRKEFGLKNDLPAAEEEMLTGTYGEMMSRKRFPPEEGSLDICAAVLHGVHAAAEKNGGLAHGAASIDLKSWRANSWRAMVMEDWGQLFSVPDDIKDDRDLMFAAVDQSKGWALSTASEALKADRSLVLRAVSHSGEAFQAAADSLKDDRDFVLEAMLAGDGSALEGASYSLRSDRDLVLMAASRGKGAALKGATDSLKSNEKFVLDVLAKDPVAYKYASEELLNSKEFAIAAVKRNGKVLQHMSGTFRADRDIATVALGSDVEALPFIHAARRSEFAGPVLSGPDGEQDHKAPKDGPIYLGVPLTPEAAKAGLTYRTMSTQKYVVFTALSTITPNMGQANYIAANAYMDKLPFYSRPVKDTVGIMWGTVGGMGMRFKAFGSQDFMNMTPDNLLSINDCCKMLHVITTLQDTPEWFAANFFDEGTRNAMLSQTAGMIRPSEAALVPPAQASARYTQDAKGKQQAKRFEEESTSGPLGGWPLVAKPMQSELSPILGPPGKDMYEGAQVVLTGIKNGMNGATGKLLQVYPEGKCRVALDNGKGNALIRPENVQVILAGPA